MARLQENFEAVYAENGDEADFTDLFRIHQCKRCSNSNDWIQINDKR